jgi:hypothetical protein
LQSFVCCETNFVKQIQIIGGGLAGLSLGILLRRESVPVSIIEAGQYPRHRVCGEFVSGKGRAVLQELGLEKDLLAMGAREAQTAAFCVGRSEAKPRKLPESALCISRHVLDEFLAKKFCEAGGDLRTGERWRGSFDAGVIRATGHKTAPTGKGWRWFGLKVHLRGVQLDADLEMHLVENGYVGLCRLDKERVNVCGLFRSRTATPDLARNWQQWLEENTGSILSRRLQTGTYDRETFCATAGLNLDAQRAELKPECRIGDTITMIAPMTGNGMSMAFESARMAAAELVGYSGGKVGWEEATAMIAKKCDRAFRRRLFWGRRLQQAAFARGVSNAAVWLGMHSDLLWRALFCRTR